MSILSILLIAFIILVIQLIFIVLASRFGWFLIVVKFIINYFKKRKEKRLTTQHISPQEE